VIELVGIIGVMGVSLLAARLVLSADGPTAADMLKVLGFLGLAGTSLKPLANLNNNLQAASAAATRLRELIDMPVEAVGPEAAEAAGPALPRHQAYVSFENVTYTYPGASVPAVAGVDLTAQHGQTVAIVGPNGSGKTTLLSLLPRLLEPETGRIVIDGQDISAVSLKSLRTQMAMVTQRTVLFRGTIADNIAYGHPEASDADIRAAAASAMADEFIATLPEGYDTYLGEGGAGLSGGQQQRLAIARAILRDPSILILDEATSQIDAESEQRITEALSRLRVGRTTFVIAHRLSTVIDADQIAVMQGGEVVARGTHAELLESSAVYRGLTNSQLQPASS
jgi:ABC-type multidrug transport system fused ATPase/permease subunit